MHGHCVGSRTVPRGWVVHHELIGYRSRADENQEKMMSNDTNDTEGHAIKRQKMDDAETEGHVLKQHKVGEDGDDAEGHVIKSHRMEDAGDDA